MHLKSKIQTSFVGIHPTANPLSRPQLKALFIQQDAASRLLNLGMGLHGILVLSEEGI